MLGDKSEQIKTGMYSDASEPILIVQGFNWKGKNLLKILNYQAKLVVVFRDNKDNIYWCIMQEIEKERDFE